VLVFLYLTQTEEKTMISNDSAITTGIVAAAYLVSISLGFSGTSAAFRTLSPLNFAIALGIISMSTFAGDINETNYQWIFLTFNWAGSLAAVLVFELIFKNAQSAVEDKEELDEEEHHEELTQPLN